MNTKDLTEHDPKGAQGTRPSIRALPKNIDIAIDVLVMLKYGHGLHQTDDWQEHALEAEDDLRHTIRAVLDERDVALREAAQEVVDRTDFNWQPYPTAEPVEALAERLRLNAIRHLRDVLADDLRTQE